LGAIFTGREGAEMIDFRKNMGYYDPRYSALDPTTSHYEFQSYQECCWSLNRPVRIGAFMRYRNYLKEVGVL
jgi:hypothetical protein